MKFFKIQDARCKIEDTGKEYLESCILHHASSMFYSVPKFLQLAILIVFLMIPLGGCKKEQPVVEKPMAEKVKSTEVGKDMKESEEARDVAREEYLYDSKGRRDPFLSLVAESKQKPGRKKGVTPIETFGVEEINLLAIAWDKNKYYALIMLPDGKAYTITEGTILGLQGGKVQDITEDMVVIREYIKDYKGVIIPKDTVLKLHIKEEG